MLGGLVPGPSSPLGVWWWTSSRLPDLAFDPGIPPDLSSWAQLLGSKEGPIIQHASCLSITHPGTESGTDL